MLPTMSRPPPKSIIEWFQQNYPREYDLQLEVSRRANQIFHRLPVKPTPGQAEPVRIELIDLPERGLALQMNELGVVYLGALVSAIIESLKAELEGLLSSGIGSEVIKEKVRQVMHSEGVRSSPHVSATGKKCQNCHADNRAQAQFCDQCGKRLE